MSIGYNSSVQTYSVIWGLKDATGKDFQHLDSFHVFNNRQEGTEAFTVSWSMVRRLRYRISNGEGLSQTDINQGWNKHFVFWAYPHNGRWFPPPYQGFVPDLGNGMPGNCTVPPRVQMVSSSWVPHPFSIPFAQNVSDCISSFLSLVPLEWMMSSKNLM